MAVVASFKRSEEDDEDAREGEEDEGAAPGSGFTLGPRFEVLFDEEEEEEALLLLLLLFASDNDDEEEFGETGTMSEFDVEEEDADEEVEVVCFLSVIFVFCFFFVEVVLMEKKMKESVFV